MSNRTFTLLAAIGLASVLAGTSSGDDRSTARLTKHTLPRFEEVRHVVLDHFPRYEHEPWALISRSDVEPIFADLTNIGWRVADEREIVASVLADNSLVVTKLRTPKGRKLAEQISKYPDGYDRLERIGRLPRGTIFIDDMVRGPDGYKLIEYLTEAPGGINMGRMVSKAPRGHDFNKATGHLYTVDELCRRLEESLKRAETSGDSKATSR